VDHYQFFEEYRDDAQRESAGNIIAINMAHGSFVQEGGICYRAVCPAPDHRKPNSPVIMALFNAEYLGARCKLVDEQRARNVHPALFEYLERLA
jgi:hypothetical protein